MYRIKMPDEVKKIIDTLYSAGYEAYIVGGCVRDSLLGRVPDDYDITTSAKPDEIKSLFAKTVDTGIEHGTVTVIENGKPYEVTTFRIDGEYKDNRHPVSVLYTANVRDDLARRDFTVNALAYNDKEGIVDAFSGIEDLKNGIIRCVRNPEERFAEDALRVLRGIRFSSVLGFEIEENTAEAIVKFAPNLRDVSSERIYTEWKKLLSGRDAYDVILKFKGVVDVFAPELSEKEMPTRASFESLNTEDRQIVLFAMCSASSEAFEAFAKRMKMDSKTRDTGISVLNNIGYFEENTTLDPRTFIIGKSDEVSLKSAKIAAAIGACDLGIYESVRLLIERDAPRRVAQLAVGGKELMSVGIFGKEIGERLNDILSLVALEKLDNDSKSILNYVLKNK